MDKQKQIDELSFDLMKAKNQCKQIKDCKDCKYNNYTDVDICENLLMADFLVDLGYRKLGENAVVLTREEYNELCCSIGVSREEVDRVVDMVERETRKETAEKFAERLKFDVLEDNELHEALNAYLRRDYFEYIDERCKEITEVE